MDGIKLTPQQQRLADLLLSAHGAEVGLPQILSLRISQFGARLKELRALGFDIENRLETRDGQRLSFYRLISVAPTKNQVAHCPPGQTSGLPANSESSTPSLFADISPAPEYPD